MQYPALLSTSTDTTLGQATPFLPPEKCALFRLFSVQLLKLPCLIRKSEHAIPLLPILLCLPILLRVKTKVTTMA